MARDTLLLDKDVPFVETGDFNNDGIADAVVFLKQMKALYELDGLGNGYFNGLQLGQMSLEELGKEFMSGVIGVDLDDDAIEKGGKLMSCGAESDSMVVRDFDLDGNLDVAVVETGGGQIQVYSGHGDGTSSGGFFMVVGGELHSLVAADFNGSGMPDLAVLKKGACGVFVYETDSLDQPSNLPCSGAGGCEGEGGPGCECNCMCYCKSLNDCDWKCAWEPTDPDQCAGEPFCPGDGEESCGCDCDCDCICKCTSVGTDYCFLGL